MVLAKLLYVCWLNDKVNKSNPDHNQKHPEALLNTTILQLSFFKNYTENKNKLAVRINRTKWTL